MKGLKEARRCGDVGRSTVLKLEGLGARKWFSGLGITGLDRGLKKLLRVGWRELHLQPTVETLAHGYTVGPGSCVAR